MRSSGVSEQAFSCWFLSFNLGAKAKRVGLVSQVVHSNILSNPTKNFSEPEGSKERAAEEKGQQEPDDLDAGEDRQVFGPEERGALGLSHDGDDHDRRGP